MMQIKSYYSKYWEKLKFERTSLNKRTGWSKIKQIDYILFAICILFLSDTL